MILLLACAGAPDDSGAVVATEPEAVLDGEAVVVVGEPVAFDEGASLGDAFTWDFGDGTGAEGAAVSHTYTEPGRYTVRLTATSADGRTDTASTSRVAVFPPLAAPPTASGRLVLADGRLFAVVRDADEVVVVEDGAVVRRFAVCHRPESMSAGGDTLAVACADDRVQLWDLTGQTLRTEVVARWGARPSAVAVDEGGEVWVALAGTGALARVEGEALSEIAPVVDPGALAVGGGAVFASRFRSGAEGGEALRWDGTTASFGLAPDPGPDSDTDARGLPTLLGSVALRPDGRALVLAGAKANMERGLVRDGLPLTHETTTRSALRLVDPSTGAPLARAMFDNRDRVGAVVFTPMGDRLLVAHLGAGIVDVLDPWTLTRIGGFQGVGQGLDGLATDGSVVWVLASLDRELVAYDLTAGNEEIELARIALVDDEPLAPEILLGAQVFHDAADPRMVTDAYVSCASCHPGGGGDARTWDFTDRGEGLRDTQALWAMPVDGPFHWTANFDEIQDFENAIRAFQAGDGYLSDADFAATEDPLGAPKAGRSAELDALAAYVVALQDEVPRSPWREEDGAWTAAAERGRLVFESAGCAECHASAAGSDAGWVGTGEPVLHDVGTLLPTSGGRSGGTLTGLRTPTLRGLFATAPYLHDGRAATLEDALTAHGVAPDADLVRYLLEIEGER